MQTQSYRPYKLPEKLICDTDAIITIDLVREYIAKHEEGADRYKYLDDLYKGFHRIYSQLAKEKWKPDNRLAVNFPRYITDTFLGYAYGIPVKKTHKDAGFLASVELFDRRNAIADHDYELAKMACIFGHAYEYVYQTEEALTKVAIVNPMNCFIVYDDTVSRKALFAVRYGYKSDGRTLTGEVFTVSEIYDLTDKTLSSGRLNPYSHIPITEYYLNAERISIFEGISGKVDIYNKAIGEKANDIDSFAEAYLAIMGAEIGEETVKNIRDNRFINVYNTDNAKDALVQFLTKPTADGSQENLLDRLERLIYQTSMVANISDENFGNASGTALSYKLHSMSNLAMTFDRKMQESMRRRYRLFCSLSTNTPKKDAFDEIEYKVTRNVPKNLLEESQIFQNLDGGDVSLETRLGTLSIVPDVKAEMKRVESEKELQPDKVMNHYFEESNINDKSGVLEEARGGTTKA